MKYILNLGSFINKDNKIDNLIIIDKKQSKISLLDEIGRELLNLNYEVISKLNGSEWFFVEFAYFYQRIFDKNMHPDIVDKLIQTNANLWPGLVKNDNNEACDYFIKIWKNWKIRICNNESNEWNKAESIFKNTITYLIETNKFLYIALDKENENAVNLVLDMINDLCRISPEWKAISSECFLLNFNIFDKFKNEEEDKSKIFNTLYKNMWLQSRIVSAVYVLQNKDLNELNKKTIKTLLNGYVSKNTNSTKQPIPIDKLSQILVVYISNVSCFKDNMLKKTFQSYDHLRYIFLKGAEDLKIYFQILMIKENKKSRCLSELSDFLCSDFFKIDERKELINYLKALIEFNDKKLIQEILEKVFDINNYDKQIEIYTDNMNNIIKKLQEYN